MSVKRAADRGLQQQLGCLQLAALAEHGGRGCHQALQGQLSPAVHCPPPSPLLLLLAAAAASAQVRLPSAALLLLPLPPPSVRMPAASLALGAASLLLPNTSSGEGLAGAAPAAAAADASLLTAAFRSGGALEGCPTQLAPEPPELITPA